MASFGEEEEETCFDVCALFPEREMVDATRAAELVAPLLKEDCTEMTGVKLSNKSYSKEAAEVVSTALKGRLTTTASLTVDVSDVIAGRPEAEALEVLRSLASTFAAPLEVTECDVSDNALGQKGIDALLPLFQRSLKSLKVCNNGMSAAAAAQLADLVDGCDLETFHFYNNMSGDDGATAVAKVVTPALKDLRFSGTRAGREGSLRFAEALTKAPALEKLDLADNLLATDGAKALADFLRLKPPLRVLDLRDCALGPDGWAVLLDALGGGDDDDDDDPAHLGGGGGGADSGGCGGTLEKLDVSGNDLDADCFDDTRVVPLFRGQPKLATLNADDNELQVQGVANLARALDALSLASGGGKKCALEALSVASNDVNSKGPAVVRLAEVLKAKCPNFTSLNIDGNGLTDDAVGHLTDILQDKLRPLDDNDPDADPEDEDDDLDDIIHAAAKIDLKKNDDDHS